MPLGSAAAGGFGNAGLSTGPGGLKNSPGGGTGGAQRGSTASRALGYSPSGVRASAIVGAPRSSGRVPTVGGSKPKKLSDYTEEELALLTPEQYAYLVAQGG